MESDTTGEPAESGDVPESTKGRLLVATPDLGDPNFSRTVVLMLEHDEDGAIGVVLNRPSETDVAELFPDWRSTVADPSVAFVGGPVSPDSVIALARGDLAEPTDGWAPVLDTLGTVDLAREPDALAVDVREVRVFAGYAGWSAGQLEGELALGGWFVLDSVPEDPFTADPDGLWAEVLRRQGGTVSWFAACPPDPSVN
jgi:putative transcriptional regulator